MTADHAPPGLGLQIWWPELGLRPPPGARCCPGRAGLLPVPTARPTFRSFVHNAGNRTSPHGLRRVVFFYFILLFVLIFNLNLLTCTAPLQRGPFPGAIGIEGPGCLPCLVGWLPELIPTTRTHQPQSQASPKVWPSRPLGHLPGVCCLCLWVETE